MIHSPGRQRTQSQGCNLKYLLILILLFSALLLPAGAEETSKPMLVANYYTWYATGPGPHKAWTHWIRHDVAREMAREQERTGEIVQTLGQEDIASVNWPLAGLYDSDDPEIVRWHIRLAQTAGIDAFFVDWWGPGYWQRVSRLTEFSFEDVVLPIAAEEGFKVALFDETAQFRNNWDEVKEWAVEYLNRYKDHPGYLKIGGKPVYYLYQVPFAPSLTPEKFEDLRSHVEERVGPVFWIVDSIANDGGNFRIPEQWRPVEGIDAFSFYGTFSIFREYEYGDLVPRYRRVVEEAHAAGKQMVLPVHPGHDNLQEGNPNHFEMPRHDGETLRGYLRAATEAGADFVMVTSFNEWPETTQVEPSSSWDDPYQYLKILAEWKGIEFSAPEEPARVRGGGRTPAGVRIEKIADSVVDAEAIYFVTPSWGNAVNGQSFQHDALTTFNGFQYAVYYSAERQVCIARRPVGDDSWEVVRFTDYHFRGNNTHNVVVLGISETDGTIHLAFDHHGSPLKYRVSRSGAATRPEDFDWNEELFGPITSELEPGREITRVTYPRFWRTPGGGLQFGCRIGGSGHGDKWLADYDAATGEWKDFGAFLGGQGLYQDSRSRNGYLNGLSYDHQGRLHVTWVWRETGDPMTNHDLGYAWSDDGGQRWLNNDGEPIGARGQVMTIDSPGLRIVEIPMRRGLMNAMTQAVDSRGRIHVVTFHLPDETPQQANWDSTRSAARYFHYWRDKSGEWRRNEMDFIGGRPQMWFDARDDAYFVFTGDRYNPSPELSIAAASAENEWKDWRIIHREEGPFTGQPQIDRHTEPGLLSVYVQEQPDDLQHSASPLRVLDFRAAE